MGCFRGVSEEATFGHNLKEVRPWKGTAFQEERAARAKALWQDGSGCSGSSRRLVCWDRVMGEGAVRGMSLNTPMR